MIEISASELLTWVQTGLLVMARVASLLMLAPIYGERGIPPLVRLMLVLPLTLLILPLIPLSAPLPLFGAQWWSAMAQQVLIGVAMGLTLRLVFESFALAGELIANSMGLGFAQLADPVRGVNTPIVGQFLIVVGSLLFVASGAHLTLIQGLVGSFRSGPVTDSALSLGSIRLMLDWAGSLFAGGVQLAAPVLTAMIAVNLAIGVLGRSAPTINLMSVGFPLTLVLGLLMLQWLLPSLAVVLSGWLDAAWPVMGALVH
ncbi:flagellar biosynthetic protein FliR [Panacagrimonas sp.]|uniref:flagellar biosynthetic protein FliR n=1 Tax=Panacagrimonas sp. TaxID=2480088 RepID=UPI003B5176D0